MTLPPWHKDDHLGVKGFAKVCPDCATFDAAQTPPDPRAGLRPANAFGRNVRSHDGLQYYCRHHAQQRRKRAALSPAPDLPGPLSAAAVQAVQAGTGETAGNGRRPEQVATPEGPPSGLTAAESEALVGAVAELARRLQALEASQEAGPALGPTLTSQLGALEERLVALEEIATTPHRDHDGGLLAPATPVLDAVLIEALQERLVTFTARLEAVEERLEAVEKVQREEAAVPGPDAHEPANTRSLRRWVKQIGKETQAQAARIERAEAKVAEVHRLALAAGRVNAGRAPEVGDLKEQLLVTLQPLLLGALDAHITEAVAVQGPPAPALGQEAMRALVTQIAEERCAAYVQTLPVPHTKETTMPQAAPPAVDPTSPGGTTPDAVRRTVEGVLLRHAAGLRNVAQIERDGLLEAEDISMITERISQRSATELCTYIETLCTQVRKER